ncbi:MAG: hypothetical protein FJZ89_00140 [Chloroflexi bacterium]|nr:hypothetical protein [Chloroflexota bacterium]
MLLAALLILCGLVPALYGRALIAKMFFEQLDTCFLRSDNMTVRLYLGSFGATTAYTELVTVQEGWLPHEQIIFSSYGFPLFNALDCHDSEVQLTGYSTLAFSTAQIREHLSGKPIVLYRDKRVDENEIMTWDPVRAICGLPLLLLGAIVLLFAAIPILWTCVRKDRSDSAETS